jgi:hypothetical protein
MKTNDAFHDNSLNAAGCVVLPDQTSPAPQVQDYADDPLLARAILHCARPYPPNPGRLGQESGLPIRRVGSFPF